MARLEANASNRVFEILADWSVELEALSKSEDDFDDDDIEDDDPDDLTRRSKRPSSKMGGPS